jgi:DNA-binding MarR family transcriptional regulator
MTDLDQAEQIDRLIHEPARLLILTVLVSVDGADFVFLLGITGLTRGNLSAHLAKLEDSNYVAAARTYDKTPRTTYRLTPAGRKAIDRYIAIMGTTLETLRP